MHPRSAPRRHALRWLARSAPSLLSRLILLLLLPVLAPAAPAGAQQDGRGGAVAEADRAYFAGRPAEALRGYEAVLARSPGDYEALWRAARAALSLGVLRGAPEEMDWFREAERFARRAVEAAPDRADSHYWLAAAVGKQAQNSSDIRPVVRMAEEVYREATAALRLDPSHAGAHNVMGQLYFEVMTTPTPLRVLARLFLRNQAIDDASWEKAEAALGRAVALDPTTPLFQLELGRLHARRGQAPEARAALQAVLELPAVYPTDAVVKQEAERLLGTVREAESGSR